MNIVLVAEEAAGIQTLRMLGRTPNRLAAVLTAPPSRGGGASVADVAQALELPVLPSSELRDPDFPRWLREREIDLLLNVHSLHVIPAEVVAAPLIGSFNLHPGPLPQYAGLNAPSWAIYRGEARHAVTLHWMEPGIDTGPVAYEADFAIRSDDSGLAVALRCVKLGLPLLAQLLDAAAHGRDEIPSVPQDLTQRRYFGREAPEGARIVWSRPARELVDLVRACDYAPFPSPWGGAHARLEGEPVTVTKARRSGLASDAEPGTVRQAAGDAIEVAAGDEWMVLERVQLNGQATPAAQVLAAGMRLADGS